MVKNSIPHFFSKLIIHIQVKVGDISKMFLWNLVSFYSIVLTISVEVIFAEI